MRDPTTHVELARITVVAPVSTEMHCDNCHLIPSARIFLPVILH